VIDYTSALGNAIMEYEGGAGGLTYRYVYHDMLRKHSVVIYGIPNGVGATAQSFEYPSGTERVVKLYYHHDRLASTHYLTDNVRGNVASFVSYDPWGAPTMKPVLRLGARELDLVTEYTGHAYDPVLEVYYARARMYDAANRRFMAADQWKGIILQPSTLVHYAYCINNPLKYVDLDGRSPVLPMLYDDGGGRDVRTPIAEPRFMQQDVVRDVHLPPAPVQQNAVQSTAEHDDVKFFKADLPSYYPELSCNVRNGNVSAGFEAVYILGASVAGQLGFRVAADRFLAFDTSGNFGIFETASYGGGSIGISLSLFIGVVFAPSIDILEGISVEAGVGVSIKGFSYGATWSVTANDNQIYHGVFLSIGFGVGSPFEVYAQRSRTRRARNAFTLLSDVVNILIEEGHGDIFDGIL